MNSRLFPGLLRYLWLFAGYLSICAATATAADDPGVAEDKAILAAVERVAPTVVKLDTVGGLEKVGNLLVGTGPTTGLVISDDGYIISSSFNFIQKPASVLVTLPDGTRAAAEIVATDHSRALTLLKVKSAKPLPVPEAVPVEEMIVGQWAIAVGRTYEGIKPNLSAGIVSALNRVWGKAIQTDAKVSPSNYGGPLVDIRGRVLGVLVPLSPQSNDQLAGVEWYDSGIGFAVPLTAIQAALPRLKKGQDLHPGLLGVSLKSNDMYADDVVISAVQPTSPAYNAGVKPNDKIIEVDGKKVGSQAQLKHVLSPKYAGDKVKVVLQRDKERLTKEIELVEKLVPYQHPFLGVLPLRDPSSKESPGAIVRAVFPKSPAEKAGLKTNDRIVKIDERKVTDRETAIEILASYVPNQKAKLEYVRDGETKTAEVTLSTLPDSIPDSLPAKARTDRKPYEGERPAVGQVTLRIPEVANDCLAYIPDDYDPEIAYGVVIWLHGAGGVKDEEFVERWKKLCPLKDLIVVAPKSNEAQKWQKTELKFIRQVLDDVMANYHIDRTRIVVHGQEAGASMAYLFAFENRDAVRACAAVDGPIPAGVKAPPNEPIFRQAFYSAQAAKAPAAPQIQAGIKALQGEKYPVVVKQLAEAGKYLSGGELVDMVRWIDSLDRF